MHQQDITFVYPGDLDIRTGGYRYDKRIVEELGKPDAQGHAWNVDLLSLQGDYPFPTAAQLTCAAKQFASLANGTLVVVDGLAYSVMPDIIQEHRQRLDIIALVHHPLALETGLRDSQSAQLKVSEKRALGHARHVITTSKLTASALAEYDVCATRVSAVLPGTDKADIAVGSGNTTKNLLCVATLTPRKGHRVLLKALTQLKELPWQLVCAGSTDRDSQTYQDLVQFCEHHSLTDRVHLAGELDENGLNKHFAAADLFVLASFHEGYGMVLTEAIARALPIVCTNAGAMPQTVPQGTGILVPPGDDSALASAIHTFLSDEEVRVRMQRAAVSARDNLRSWQTAGAEFSQVLLDVSSRTSSHNHFKAD